MGMTFRVIVCGGRDWTDSGAICNALDEAWSERVGRRFVLVHGACPTGADALADEWAWRADLDTDQVERHHADWKTFGRAAGPKRNEAMAAAGADLCLAFWDGRSPGTLDCIKRCVQRGIPVRIIPRRQR